MMTYASVAGYNPCQRIWIKARTLWHPSSKPSARTIEGKIMLQEKIWHHALVFKAWCGSHVLNMLQVSASAEEFMQQLPKYDADMAKKRQDAEAAGDVSILF